MKRCSALILPLLLAAAGAFAQTGRPLSIRGHDQDLYFYRASGSSFRGTILFLPGDGGWRGFAVTIAETVSSWGYDVYGLDTKRYLTSFTSGATTLTEKDVINDMRTIAEKMRREPSDKIIFLGWSEGAGFGVLATAAQENKSAFAGLVAFGLPRLSVLGWRLTDSITYITKRNPDEPSFTTTPYLPKIAPLPFVMIQATGDEYTTVEEAKKMFEAARQPKRFFLVDAQNHRFGGNQEAFFRALREAVNYASGGSGQN